MKVSAFRLLVIGAAFMVVLLASAARAGAAIINVNTTADLAAPGCPDGSANCSLRQALSLANSNGDPSNTVNVPAGTYNLPNGVLTITKAVTIQGAGAATTTLVGSGANRVLIDSGPPSATAAINGVTITGGVVTGSGPILGGAGIYNNSGAPLSLDGTVVTGNKLTVNAGGCCNGGPGIWTTNTVTLTNSSVTGNTATITAGSFCCDGGGGLYQDGGAITLIGSSISGNHLTVTGGTGNEGGGGFFEDGGSITLTDSHVDGNTASLFTPGSFSGGGGFYQDGGTTSITDSSVDGNSLSITSGGNNSGGGGFFNDGGDLTINRSAVGANSATVAGSSNNGGGGIYHNGGTPSITDSTLSSNALDLVAGTMLNGGGGIYVNGGAATWKSDTVAANKANAAGGAIFNNGGQLATFQDTIVAGNSGSSGAGCFPSGLVTSMGNNIESTDTCSFGATGDMKNTDPLLGPLQDNGGPSPTQMLLPGSPAVDAAATGACSTKDQRGEARPFGAGCDIGAVEVAPPSAFTGGAANVTASSAAVSGNAVNPDTVAGGSVLFDFGTSASYGSQAAGGSLAPGAPGAAFGATLTGLKANSVYHYRAVATTPDGTSFGADQTFKTAAAPVPSLSKLKLKPTSFRPVPGRGASIAAKRKKSGGAVLSYSDSLKATTKFTVQRPTRGFRSGKRCVARRPRAHAKARRCTFFRSLGSFSHNDKAGANHFRFTGRVKRKPLRAGRYRLQAVARTGGQKSKAKTIRFRIL